MISILSEKDILSHYLLLSPEDRFCRFCTDASDDYIVRYVKNAKGFFYGIKEIENGGPQILPNGMVPAVHYYPIIKICAVVHIVHDPKSGYVEVAVSVLPENKGKGYGKALMYFAQGIAEMYHAKSLVISGLSVNSPMIKLAQKCGYDVKRYGSEFEGEQRTVSNHIDDVISKQIQYFNIPLKQ